MKHSLSIKAISRIALSFCKVLSTFDADGFVKKAGSGLDDLELKERVRHISCALSSYLPSDFESCSSILYAVKDTWIVGSSDEDMQAFAAWPVIDYVAEYGIEAPDIAMPLLRHLTSLFSAEFAIRPFIERYPEISYNYLEQWLTDKDEHVRRLVSEGTRPRLPWGSQLQAAVLNPNKNIKLLARLKDDQSLYVRRSVANHINDISKDHPQIIIDLCRQWLDFASDERKWLVRHGLRSLIKQGESQVYPLLGYTSNPQLDVVLSMLSDKVLLGEDLEFIVELKSSICSRQSMVVDFAVAFMKANGRQQEKVFKLKNVTLGPNQELKINKRHPIRKITTRRYYRGEQALILLINGREIARQCFELDF